MSEIKNGRLDQYGAEPFEQQQFGSAGVEGVNVTVDNTYIHASPDNTNRACTTTSWERRPCYLVNYSPS